MVNDQPSRATAYCGTSAASSAPKVPAWTKGKCATSRKLSASRPAEARATSVGSSPASNDGSSASGIEPSGAMRFLGGQEHDAVRLGQSGRAARAGPPAAARAPGTERGNLDAGARGVEAPTVVGALEHVRLAVPDRQGRAAMRAAIGESHDPPAGPVEHPWLAQEQEPGAAARSPRPAGPPDASSAAGRDRRWKAGGPWRPTLVRPLAGVKKGGTSYSPGPMILDRFTRDRPGSHRHRERPRHRRRRRRGPGRSRRRHRPGRPDRGAAAPGGRADRGRRPAGRGRGGRSHRYRPDGITGPDGLRRAGPVDIIVNNLGGTMPRPLLDTSPRFLEEAFHFNVGAGHALVRAAVPLMLEGDAPGGAIVNVSSVMGHAAPAATWPTAPSRAPWSSTPGWPPRISPRASGSTRWRSAPPPPPPWTSS